MLKKVLLSICFVVTQLNASQHTHPLVKNQIQGPNGDSIIELCYNLSCLRIMNCSNWPEDDAGRIKNLKIGFKNYTYQLNNIPLKTTIVDLKKAIVGHASGMSYAFLKISDDKQHTEVMLPNFSLGFYKFREKTSIAIMQGQTYRAYMQKNDTDSINKFFISKMSQIQNDIVKINSKIQSIRQTPPSVRQEQARLKDLQLLKMESSRTNSNRRMVSIMKQVEQEQKNENKVLPSLKTFIPDQATSPSSEPLPFWKR